MLGGCKGELLGVARVGTGRDEGVDSLDVIWMGGVGNAEGGSSVLGTRCLKGLLVTGSL